MRQEEYAGRMILCRGVAIASSWAYYHRGRLGRPYNCRDSAPAVAAVDGGELPVQGGGERPRFRAAGLSVFARSSGQRVQS